MPVTSPVSAWPSTTAAAAAVAGPQRCLLTAYNLVEEVSLRWLAQVCGLDPDRMKGIYSSGSAVREIRVDDRQRLDVAALAERLTADRAAGVVPIAVVANLAAYLARLTHEHPRLEVLAEPTLSITCFRYAAPGAFPAEADALTAAVYRELVRTTPFVPSTTRVAGALAIRPCFTNPRSDLEHVAGLADAVARIGDALTGR